MLAITLSQAARFDAGARDRPGALQAGKLGGIKAEFDVFAGIPSH